jgi:hypothetical protein
MSELDLTVGACRVRMTYAASLSVNHLVSLVTIGHAMSEALDLDWARFLETAPGVFDYRIRLQDGRMWRQEISFTGTPDGNPSMTFAVNPGWQLDEFSAQRDWRVECISLRNSAGASSIRLDHVA